MSQEQFGQFWEQLKASLKAKWTGISDEDLVEIKGDLAAFGTILPIRHGELRKDDVMIWARRRYCYWSGHYIDYQEELSAV